MRFQLFLMLLDELSTGMCLVLLGEVRNISFRVWRLTEKMCLSFRKVHFEFLSSHTPRCFWRPPPLRASFGSVLRCLEGSGVFFSGVCDKSARGLERWRENNPFFGTDLHFCSISFCVSVSGVSPPTQHSFPLPTPRPAVLCR